MNLQNPIETNQSGKKRLSAQFETSHLNTHIPTIYTRSREKPSGHKTCDTTSCWRLNVTSCTFTLFHQGGPSQWVRMHFGEMKQWQPTPNYSTSCPMPPCTPPFSCQTSRAQAFCHCFYYYHCNFSFNLCTKKNKQYISGGWSTPT